MKKLAGFLFILFLVIGCQSTIENREGINIITKVNQSEQVSNDLSIKVKIVNDSRCPEGCECFWAGDVRVFFTLRHNDQIKDTSLVLPSRPNMQFNNYLITLEEVNPYPICNNPIPNSYLIYFRINDINK